MKKIKLPFYWNLDFNPIIYIQFPTMGNCESSSFFMDLRTGEIIGVSEDISLGECTRNENNPSFIIEGNGWWIGHDSSEELDFLEGDSKLEEIFTWENINLILNQLIEFSKRGEFKDLAFFNSDLYETHIKNEKSPIL